MTRSLISVDDLTPDGVDHLLETADRFAEVMRRDIKKVPSLRGRSVVNLFFEPSTRTATSFELAGKRLSADVVNVKGSGSSVEKGESLRDTILTLDAYMPDVIVIRHPAAGAAAFAARVSDAGIVNAGDGANQHPTQALLDLYTARAAMGRLDGLSVAFVGDLLHSRVARSSIAAFRQMGADVIAVGPPTLLPREAEQSLGARVSTDMADIADADLVYVLRMQLERMGRGGFVPSLREYAATYGVSHARLRPGQRVMHAGPVNRGVEISDALCDDPEALIVQQAANGMVVRMAVLYDMLAERGLGEVPAQREEIAA
jgi:aspartate carbamoyltransferase catalytic subunit